MIHSYWLSLFGHCGLSLVSERVLDAIEYFMTPWTQQTLVLTKQTGKHANSACLSFANSFLCLAWNVNIDHSKDLTTKQVNTKIWHVCFFLALQSPFRVLSGE